MIEVILPTDESEKVQAKRSKYFRAGVQIVWYILPEIREVHVCTSPKLIQVCTDEDICSAAPVLPDFSLTVNALFV